MPDIAFGELNVELFFHNEGSEEVNVIRAEGTHTCWESSDEPFLDFVGLGYCISHDG